MKVVRKITYESDDVDKLQKQMKLSLRDGSYPWMTRITVETIERDWTCPICSSRGFDFSEGETATGQQYSGCEYCTEKL